MWNTKILKDHLVHRVNHRYQRAVLLDHRRIDLARDSQTVMNDPSKTTVPNGLSDVWSVPLKDPILRLVCFPDDRILSSYTPIFEPGTRVQPFLDRILWTDFSVIGFMFDPAKLFGSVKGHPGGLWIPGLSQALNILGSHQFTHGRHYWEVEIAPFDLVECSNWIIGVSYSSVERNSWLGASEGTWILPCNGILMPKF